MASPNSLAKAAAGVTISITQVEVQRLFLAAVSSSKVMAVMISLDEGACVLGRTPEGSTALQLATDVNDADLIHFLRSTMEAGSQMKVRRGVMKEVVARSRGSR